METRKAAFGFFIIGILLLAGIGDSRAQDGKKWVRLVDSIYHTPVAYAVVSGEANKTVVLTDDNGMIALGDELLHETFFTVSCIGYETKRVAVVSLRYEKGIAQVALQPRITDLSEVSVKALSQKGIFKTISDLDIHLRPINNSQEVLRMVPGLFIGQHAGGGKAEQIFLRGFDIDHGTDINITADGLPVNMVSHAHGQGYADLHFVLPELIEQVNFEKGPYRADKGNFTTAGFVEFKTKDFLDRSFVKLEAGQFNSLRGIAAFNLLPAQKEHRDRSLFFAGEGSYTNGYFESPQHFNRFNGMLKYHQQFGSRQTLTAFLTGFSSRWNASGQIPDRAVDSIGFFGAIDNTEGGNTSRYNASVQLESRLHNGSVWHNQLFCSRYAFKLYSNFTFFLNDPVNGDQIRQKEERNILGYNSSWSHTYHIGRIKTRTEAGVQLRYDDINHIELTHTKNRITDINTQMLGNINEMNAGIYLSQQFFLSKRFDITAGLRGDYFNNRYNDLLTRQDQKADAAIISPKLMLKYQASDKVRLYLSGGKGFHSNDTRVVVPQNGKDILPPAWGSDLGGIFKVGKKLILQSALWYLWLDQEFVYVGDEGVVEAGGQTQRYGWDLSVRYQPWNNWYADVDLNLTHPRVLHVAKAESYIPLAPTFTSTGGITYRKQQGWNGSLRYRWMGDRAANEDKSVIAKGYFVMDAAVNYTKLKWEAGLTIQNLLNKQWKETQFDTESKLYNEPIPVSEIHFTAGTPFFSRLSLSLFF